MPGKKASEAQRRHQILKAAHDIGLRQGIEGVTVRAVAARARLSHGLVLFHFKRKDQLVNALLDRVLATTLSPSATEDLPSTGPPWDRLRTLVRNEVDRLSRDPRQVRLFLEYWALANRKSVIRGKISAQLERYRAGFRLLAEEVVYAEPSQFVGITPHGLAAVTVSFINGCAVQAMVDPGRFDVEEYLAAVQGILGWLQMPAEVTEV